MRCSNCGSEITDGKEFCSVCGARQSSADSFFSNPAMSGDDFGGGLDYSSDSSAGTYYEEPAYGYTEPSYAEPVYEEPGYSEAGYESAYDYGTEAKPKKKKGLIGLIIGLVAAVVLGVGGFIIYGVTSGGGDTKGTPKPTEAVVKEPDDDWTIMIFMVGASDLEPNFGFMSKTIKTIQAAEYGDNINVIIQTGGASKWQHEDISADKIQRWSVEDGELVLLEEMDVDHYVTTEGLSDFMEFAIDNYPAKRYGIVLNSHGGGTIGGFGSDEYYPEDNLSISDLHEAFATNYEDTGVKFEFIGFDACLMATLDVAYALKDYGNYMIASEETETVLTNMEEGYNTWTYEDWLTLLGEEPDMPMEDPESKTGLGRLICSTYFDSYNYDDIETSMELNGIMHTTLTLIDLSKVDAAYEAMCEFYAEASDYMTSEEGWRKIVAARANCKGFGDDQFEQIDILYFLNESELPFEKMDDWEKAIRDVVAYKRNDAKYANGIAIYFPYLYLDYYNTAKGELEKIGYGSDYFALFGPYVAKCQGYLSASAESDSSKTEATPSMDDDTSGNNKNSALWSDNIPFTSENGQKVIRMTSDEVNSLDYASAQFFVNDGNDNIYLVGELGGCYYFDGSNNTFEAMDAVYYMDINGVAVTTLCQGTGKFNDTGNEYFLQYIPAVVNGMNGNLRVAMYIDDSGNFVTIEGGFVVNNNGEDEFYSLESTDTIELMAVYINTEDGSYSYEKSAPVTYGEGLNIQIKYDTTTKSAFRYVFYDYYGNKYYSDFTEVN